MAGSLQDQLLNLGVANKKQAQQAKTEKRKKTKAKKGGQAQPTVSAEEKALKAREEKAARDRALNRQREQERAARALEAEIGQLIERHRVAIPHTADVPYNFVHGGKVKRLYVTASLQEQLARGALAIAPHQERYLLIPRPIAERIEAREAGRVILVQSDERPDPDDPYADYPVPDDLMW